MKICIVFSCLSNSLRSKTGLLILQKLVINSNSYGKKAYWWPATFSWFYWEFPKAKNSNLETQKWWCRPYKFQKINWNIIYVFLNIFFFFQGICYPVPTHLAQRQEPWQRLSSQHTLSSARHEVYHHDPAAPVDDLDFVLKSKYNQHNELLKNKNEVVYQPETMTDNHGWAYYFMEVIVFN